MFYTLIVQVLRQRSGVYGVWIPAYKVLGLSYKRELSIDKIRIMLIIKNEPYVVPSWSCVGFIFCLAEDIHVVSDLFFDIKESILAYFIRAVLSEVLSAK